MQMCDLHTWITYALCWRYCFFASCLLITVFILNADWGRIPYEDCPVRNQTMKTQITSRIWLFILIWWQNLWRVSPVWSGAMMCNGNWDFDEAPQYLIHEPFSRKSKGVASSSESVVAWKRASAPAMPFPEITAKVVEGTFDKEMQVV